MSTPTKIKAVLIGAGGWGLQHARILSERPDVDFLAIAGRTPEKTRSRAAQFGVRAYMNITDMLKEEKPDLAFLSLPNDGHFQPTLEVIRAGVPLFVEKPLVFDLKEADQLLQGRRTAICSSGLTSITIMPSRWPWRIRRSRKEDSGI